MTKRKPHEDTILAVHLYLDLRTCTQIEQIYVQSLYKFMYSHTCTNTDLFPHLGISLPKIQVSSNKYLRKLQSKHGNVSAMALYYRINDSNIIYMTSLLSLASANFFWNLWYSFIKWYWAASWFLINPLLWVINLDAEAEKRDYSAKQMWCDQWFVLVQDNERRDAAHILTIQAIISYDCLKGKLTPSLGEKHAVPHYVHPQARLSEFDETWHI